MRECLTHYNLDIFGPPDKLDEKKSNDAEQISPLLPLELACSGGDAGDHGAAQLTNRWAEGRRTANTNIFLDDFFID